MSKIEIGTYKKVEEATRHLICIDEDGYMTNVGLSDISVAPSGTRASFSCDYADDKNFKFFMKAYNTKTESQKILEDTYEMAKETRVIQDSTIKILKEELKKCRVPLWKKFFNTFLKE